ncbi:MAG: phosphatidate cytidylyltransferase [Candidatus Omnitrophica bacterium]|nr:phosphatidate cytidylyltransferase [Candidatus Omnitrophota bacterium]
MNRERLISSSLMIGLVSLALLHAYSFLALLLILTIGGLYEFFYLIHKKGIPIYSYTGIAIGVMIPLTTFMRFQPTKGWELLFIVLVLLAIFFMQFLRRENTNAIIGISTTLFGVLYVSWLFSFLIKIRYLADGMEGVGLVAFILVVTKCGDIGALMVGSMWGRHPLLPRVSPHKTIEGSIGSFLFSMTAAFVCRNWLPAVLHIPLWQVGLAGLCIGGIGQIGDMSESLIKRDCNVKDSGKMFRGLGGILDTIDSLLFTAPTFYFYIAALMDKLR